MSKRSAKTMSSRFTNSTDTKPMKRTRRWEEDEQPSPQTSPGNKDEMAEYGFAMQKMLRMMEESYNQSQLTKTQMMNEYCRTAQDIVQSKCTKFVERQNENNSKLMRYCLEETDILSKDLKGLLGNVKNQENQFRMLAVEMEKSFLKAPASEIPRSCNALDELMDSYLKDAQTLNEQFQKEIEKMEREVKSELKSLQEKILNKTKQMEKENFKRSLKDFPLF